MFPHNLQRMKIQVVVEHCPLSTAAITILIRAAVTTAKDPQDQAS